MRRRRVGEEIRTSRKRGEREEKGGEEEMKNG